MQPRVHTAALVDSQALKPAPPLLFPSQTKQGFEYQFGEELDCWGGLCVGCSCAS